MFLLEGTHRGVWGKDVTGTGNWILDFGALSWQQKHCSIECDGACANIFEAVVQALGRMACPFDLNIEVEESNPDISVVLPDANSISPVVCNWRRPLMTMEERRMRNQLMQVASSHSRQ